MKVGDLVELSAYGEKIKSLKALRYKKGLVVERCYGGAYLRVIWFGSSRNRKTNMRRSDLKHARVKST